MAGESQADGGSSRSAIRWGLVLAAAATLGFRLPRLAHEMRAWRAAVQSGDAPGAESLRILLIADSIGFFMVLAFGLAIYFFLRPRRQSQP